MRRVASSPAGLGCGQARWVLPCLPGGRDCGWPSRPGPVTLPPPRGGGCWGGPAAASSSGVAREVLPDEPPWLPDRQPARARPAAASRQAPPLPTALRPRQETSGSPGTPGGPGEGVRKARGQAARPKGPLRTRAGRQAGRQGAPPPPPALLLTGSRSSPASPGPEALAAARWTEGPAFLPAGRAEPSQPAHSGGALGAPESQARGGRPGGSPEGHGGLRGA